jgi:hypothetical protein
MAVSAPAAPAPAPTPDQGTGYTPSILGPVYDQIDTFANSAVNAIPIIGPTLTNIGNSFDAGLNNLLGFQPETPQDRARIAQAQTDQFPVAAATGTVAGTVAPFVVAGGAIPGAAKVLGMEGPLASRILLGGASSGLIGGADSAARGDSVPDSIYNGITDAILGGAAAPVADAVTHALGAVPTVIPTDALETVKNALYNKVDQSGVRFAPQAYRQMAHDVATEAVTDNLNPGIHPKATAFLRTMLKQDPGYSPTLTQLDQLRQQVWRDVGSGDPGERHFAGIISKGIDNLIDTSAQGNEAIRAARAANATWEKSSLLGKQEEKAIDRAASTGSGGNIDNVIRQNVRAILDKGAKGFTPEEIAQMRKVVRGGPIQNTMRWLGKLSPHGNGLMFGLEGGAFALHPDPKMLAIPAVGMVAKALADSQSRQGIRELQALVSQGGRRVTQYNRPVVQAIMRNALGPGQMTMLENRSAGAPGPIVQALVQAAAQ